MAAFVSSVKEPGRYHDGKGLGLFLLVKPTGARSWVQRIVIRGARREMGLGSPPVVTLAAARRKTRATLTFAEAAHRAHVEFAPTWKNPMDAAAFLTFLET